MEDYQIPPWSNDYHFNINVQMVYRPLLAANHLAHFRPLWAMLENWMPSLRANARAFFENDKAIMLPHAVDDRGRVIGSFWTGSTDHGCTAWMAQMAWEYYRQTGSLPRGRQRAAESGSRPRSGSRPPMGTGCARIAALPDDRGTDQP